MQSVVKKIKSNLRIYKQDIQTKGIYYSVIHRLYKIPKLKSLIAPIVNSLKPSFVYIDNHKIFIDKSDSIVSENLLFSHQWEDFETKLFKKNIKKGAVVLDIGAHIGYYTLIAANLVGDKGLVYAFEPDKRNFQLLEKNIKENGFKNVVLINKAVTKSGGKIKLYLNKENTGDHRVYNSKDQRESISIESISLDNFFTDLDTKIDLIKIDIQGAELEALKGGLKVLKRNRNLKIFTEFWPLGLKLNNGSSQDYINLLASFNFKFYEINETKKKLTIISPKDLLEENFFEKKDYTNLVCTV